MPKSKTHLARRSKPHRRKTVSEQPVVVPGQPQPALLTPDQIRFNKIIMQVRERLNNETDRCIMLEVEISDLREQLEQERQFRMGMAAEIHRLKEQYEPETLIEDGTPPEGAAVPIDIPEGEPSPLPETADA